jgi:hypothetical protein
MPRTITTHRQPCDQCQIVYINGLRCHETGCPEAWKDAKRDCKWCGCAFAPENPLQHLCSNECAESYNS